VGNAAEVPRRESNLKIIVIRLGFRRGAPHWMFSLGEGCSPARFIERVRIEETAALAAPIKGWRTRKP